MENNNLITIRQAGLSEAAAKAYLTLLENGKMTPAELATKIGETRTNGYMLIEKLVGLKLAEKVGGAKTAAYIPLHPSALETIAEQRRKSVEENEVRVKQNLNSLTSLYFESSERPGVKFLEGEDGLKRSINDQLDSTGDIYFLRTRSDDKTLPAAFFARHQSKLAEKNITTHMLSDKPAQPRDREFKTERTVYSAGAYTAPVAINVYDNKVNFTVYGGTETSMIVQSPEIADSMRQLLKLVTKLLRERPHGHDSPHPTKPRN
jgi:sugar-specific transcriptional regulator TrmB